ncbi:hypothetical protein F4779DRAFT_587214 [Xylariaceae sp. FL0662B]|nr:hypothetical protein F4779DRAFT_587214 [Xylariaceae sp. FL0662B]
MTVHSFFFLTRLKGFNSNYNQSTGARVTMKLSLSFLLGAATSAAAAVRPVPSLKVPACAVGKGTLQYNKSVPDKVDFPLTQVDACYEDTSIRLTFTAFEEVNFYYNESYKTNDPIWEYEVMEVFIHHGRNDPQTYLEFEISPNNVTFQAFIYNPSKVRATGAPMDTMFLTEPVADGLTAETILDKEAQTWTSSVAIPLGLFNIDNGKAAGTKWRMNFFRTVVSPDTFPDQFLGAWNPTNESNFHMTPFFGNVVFL